MIISLTAPVCNQSSVHLLVCRGAETSWVERRGVYGRRRAAFVQQITAWQPQRHTGGMCWVACSLPLLTLSDEDNLLTNSREANGKRWFSALSCAALTQRTVEFAGGGIVCKQHLRGTQSSNACISCTVKGVAINSAGGFHTSLRSRVPFLVNSLSAAVPALMLITSGVVRCQCFLTANTIWHSRLIKTTEEKLNWR